MYLEATEKANTDDRIATAGAPDLPGVGCSSTTKPEDDANVRAHGHAQAMPRQFNWISALGLGFSITNSWVGYLSCFGQTVAYGGTQSCIFGLVVAFVVQLIVTLGLAELASAFPSSGGQYHFCYILSPDCTKRYSAYVVGWLSMLGWWVATCSGTSLVALCLGGIANFYHSDYLATPWQTYLIYLGVSVITVTPVFAASKRISLVTQCSLYLTLGGYLVFFVVVLSKHQQVQPGSFLLASTQGNSGWGRGLAWILAINNSMYACAGTDAAIHICEELPQPGRRVPQVMMMTLAIGAVTSISLFVALMFFVDDIDAVRDSPLPSLELVYQITGNRSITLGLFIILALIYTTSLPAEWVTAGRIAWAFARDVSYLSSILYWIQMTVFQNGLPFPEYFSQINKTFDFPVHTTLAAFLFTSLYGLLYLASTTAFNSIITSAVLFLNISYTVPQGILLVSGRSSMPKRYLNLGWAGYFCNGFAVVWIVIQGVLTCLPPDPEVTLGSMNYVCVILVGVFLVINLLWVAVGRKTFSGPDINWGVVKTGQRE
ncbi:hypothetical protein AnigIFM62618_002025 [Aspergillus niger]|nr:hypothetical protein AnigIFM62618_002025 [Aspergillus niger]